VTTALKLSFLLPALGAAACTQATGPAPPAPPAGLSAGDHQFSVPHDGLSRSYRVHVPTSPPRALAVLLAFHGGAGNAAQFQAEAAFDAHADANRYLVVYPDGTGPLGFHVWNAGGCCGAAPEDDVDDVGFVAAVIADLASRVDLDLDRVYATGHSNGSMMAHRLAAEAADLVAAIAPYAGAPYFDILGFAPARPVPVLHIHSVDDPRALYDGGLGPPFPVTGVRNQMNPVEAELDRWIAHNGCPAVPSIGTTVHGQTGTISEGHSVTLHRWSPCAAAAEVRLLKLTGSGHAWPGVEVTPVRELIVGPGTEIIDIEQEIWAFVSTYTR
jgi:polyhydroxybutyrate depolymerase